MRSRKLWPFIAVGVFLVLAAGGLAIGWNLAGDGKKVADRPSSAASPAHADPGGKSACEMIETAFEDAYSWNDHGLVAHIVAAAKQSTDKYIVFEGTLLERRLTSASAAMGQRDQPEMDRALKAEMQEMQRQCQRAGL